MLLLIKSYLQQINISLIMYLLLTLSLIGFSIVFIYSKYIKSVAFFNDDIDYTVKSPAMKLHKHIHNTIINNNSDPSRLYYQFYNISIPTKSGDKIIESLLVTNSGVYVFNVFEYEENLIYSDIGYTSEHKNGLNTKIHIPKTIDTTILDGLKNTLSIYEINKIEYYNVITSQIDFKIQRPDNLIVLSEVPQIINSSKYYDPTTVKTVIGALLVHQSIRKNKAA